MQFIVRNCQKSKNRDIKSVILESFDKQELENTKASQESIYNYGYTIFKSLPTLIRQVYQGFEANLSENDIVGLEKNIFYRKFTQDLLKKAMNDKYISVTNEKGAEVKIETKTIIGKLEQLLINYDEVNEANGISAEAVDKFFAKLSEAKSMKDYLSNKFKLERTKLIAEFQELETFEVT